MTAKVSSFSAVRMNNYDYVFIVAGWNEFVTPITDELYKQIEPFGEALGLNGLVVQPYKSATRNTLDEVTGKNWDKDIRARFDRETYPFIIIINTDFAKFNPASHFWSIIWFSEYENQPSRIVTLFQKLANKTRTNKNVFSYLKCVTLESKVKRVAKYIELKPAVFGISIDAKAILNDLKC